MARHVCENYKGNLEEDVRDMSQHLNFDVDDLKVQELKQNKIYGQQDQDIFECMLWCLITKHGEGLDPENPLISVVSDFMWFWLFLCSNFCLLNYFRKPEDPTGVGRGLHPRPAIHKPEFA